MLVTLLLENRVEPEGFEALPIIAFSTDVAIEMNSYSFNCGTSREYNSLSQTITGDY